MYGDGSLLVKYLQINRMQYGALTKFGSKKSGMLAGGALHCLDSLLSGSKQNASYWMGFRCLQSQGGLANA